MTDIPPGTITRANWNSRVWPIELAALMLSKLLTGSPFANSLTAAPTSSGVMVWPLVSPEGAAWLAEAQRFPSANLNDEVYEVAVCKLGTLISLSNESVDDTAYPLSQNVGRAIADSCGPIVDNAFLYGEGGLAPKGVWDAAPAADEAPDFRAAAIIAWGELANAGAPFPRGALASRAGPVRKLGAWPFSRTPCLRSRSPLCLEVPLPCQGLPRVLGAGQKGEGATSRSPCPPAGERPPAGPSVPPWSPSPVPGSNFLPRLPCRPLGGRTGTGAGRA